MAAAGRKKSNWKGKSAHSPKFFSKEKRPQTFNATLSIRNRGGKCPPKLPIRWVPEPGMSAGKWGRKFVKSGKSAATTVMKLSLKQKRKKN